MYVQPACNSPASARSLLPYRTPATSEEGIVDLSEVSEVMSPQVSQEIMGPVTVQDLPRYLSGLKACLLWVH